MPETQGVIAEVATPPIATDGTPESNIDTSVSEAVEAPEQSSQEAIETPEPDKPVVDESKIPESFREHAKGVERDMLKYKPAWTGLETTAQELFGANSPEHVAATIQAIQAAAPLLKVVLDPSVDPTTAVSTLQKALPPERLEDLVWAGLNDPATQDVILQDKEVQRWISEKVLNGKSIEEVQAILQNAESEPLDPAQEAWRKEQSDFRSERARERAQQDAIAGQQKAVELQQRFFVNPATEVIREWNLAAPEGASPADKQLFDEAVKDIQFAAQGRFLEANMAEYQAMEGLYTKGQHMPAVAKEALLQSKFRGFLNNTAERYLGLLKTRSDAARKSQEEKLNGVRPETSGGVSASSSGEKFDIYSPNFLEQFQRSMQR